MKRLLVSIAISLSPVISATAEVRHHPVPPADLPFEQMTPAELGQYNLPPDLATNPKQRLLLDLLKSGTLHTAEPLNLKLPVNMGRMQKSRFPADPSLPVENYTRITSSNWSGPMVVKPSNVNQVGTVIGSPFTVPFYDPSYYNSISIWVGEGGFSDPTLLQTGVVCIPQSLGFNGCLTFEEWYSDGAIGIYPVSQGDQIIPQAWRTPGEPLGHIVVIDGTTGAYASDDFDCQSCGTTVPFHTAEWIVEAPTDGNTGQIIPLAPYGVVPWKNAYTYHPLAPQNTGQFSGNPDYLIAMHNSSGNIISSCVLQDRLDFYCVSR
jgi:hypothetical protein